MSMMTTLARFLRLYCTVLALALLPAVSGAVDDGTADAALTATVTALDRKLFDAYNACDLDTFTTLFTPDVEFYHDKGGATFDRDTVVANTRQYICGKVRRELLTETLRIYPIKDYGAIEEGEHRFCELATGRCEGSAKFLMIWKRDGDDWRMTRVISFGHRPLTEAEKAKLAADETPTAATTAK